MPWGREVDIKWHIGWVVKVMYIPSGYEGGLVGWEWYPKLVWRAAVGVNQPQTYGRHGFTTYSNLNKNIEVPIQRAKHLALATFSQQFFSLYPFDNSMDDTNNFTP